MSNEYIKQVVRIGWSSIDNILSNWRVGVKSGKYTKPIKLTEYIATWRAEYTPALIGLTSKGSGNGS